MQEYWSIEYNISKLAIDGIYHEDGVSADVGVTMFQAGATDWDQQLKESGIFVGSRGLCCR
jgi:hypothetical protein